MKILSKEYSVQADFFIEKQMFIVSLCCGQRFMSSCAVYCCHCAMGRGVKATTVDMNQEGSFMGEAPFTGRKIKLMCF